MGLLCDSRNVIWLNGRKAVISNFESGKPDTIDRLLMLSVTLLASWRIIVVFEVYSVITYN